MELNNFQSVGLGELSAVALMKRVDTKVLAHVDQLTTLLEDLKSHNYSVLEIEGSRLMGYENIYFDTESLEFYFQHHNGRAPRTKVRKRKYTANQLCFLEVKRKTNKGKTEKARLRTNNFSSSFNQEEMEFLQEQNLGAYNLKASVSINFDRVTLASPKMDERLTIDCRISASNESGKMMFEDLAVLELKQSKYSGSSKLWQSISNLSLRQGRFSKYCNSIARLNPNLKQNNFKPTLRQVSKLTGLKLAYS